MISSNKKKYKPYNKMQLENMQRIEMPGDNHCGYHAMIYNLKRVNHEKFDRNRSLKDQILFLKDILIRTYDELNSPRANRLRVHPNEWLNDKDMEILSKYFNVCIYVKDDRIQKAKNSNRVEKEIPTVSYIGDETACNHNFYMLQTEGHFDVLIPSGFQTEDIPTLFVQITKKDIQNYMEQDQEDFSTTDQEHELSFSMEKPKLVVSPKKLPRKSTYIDIEHRDCVLTNEEIEKLVEKKLHADLFPTWLR
jgi:hypothetical protein